MWTIHPVALKGKVILETPETFQDYFFPCTACQQEYKIVPVPGIKKRILPKGSLKNQFAISGVEAPGWQGVETQDYQAYFEFPQHSQAGWIDV